MDQETLQKLIDGAVAEIRGHLDNITPGNCRDRFAAIAAVGYWAASVALLANGADCVARIGIAACEAIGGLVDDHMPHEAF